ncbi:MAG: hypothetical protein GF309_06395 [Candidatus Lokiarchaeota archaeon]|nr:hypothetical protein [Candidatus Lokiarchaeota archaeon]
MRTMVQLFFGELTCMDVILAVFTGVAGATILAIAYRQHENGTESWKARKLVHVSMGTIIGLSIMSYSNLTGPLLATGIFCAFLMYAWAHNSNLIWDLLLAGSRDGEDTLGTFASGIFGLTSFGVVFLLFLNQPSILVSAILTVSWGDAAGEIIGRPFGGALIPRPFGDKSIEGMAAVFFFSVFACIASLLLYATISIFDVAFRILFIGFCISMLEFVSRRWLDNLLLPLGTALLMWAFIFPSMTLF